MNDKIIINTILKIHFILISAISFIFLTLSIVFIILQNGVFLDSISIANFQAKKLYIKWDEKISLFVEEIQITKNKKDSQTSIDADLMQKILKNTVHLDSLINKIVVQKISFNDIEGSFEYIDGQDGYLKLNSPNFSLDSSLSFESNLFNIKINKLLDHKRSIKLNGNIILNTTNKIELVSILNIDINNDAKFKLYLQSDTKKLKYKIDSLSDIKDTRYIVDLFNMDKKAKYWLYDAIDTSSLTIKNAAGWLEYDKINEAYLNLHVNAVANNLTYTYDTLLQSVKTTHTDLEYKKGVLYIKPKNAYSYGFYLDKSWLKIDFSKPEEILTLHLLFNGQANQGLLSLLHRYKIDLPFIQKEGELETDLTLVINLITTDVEATGNFYTKKALINYLGLDIDLFDVNIELKNTDVKVKNMFAKYQDIATAYVDLDFDAKKSKGVLDFRVQDVSVDNLNLKLKATKKPLHVAYNITPNKDFIEIAKSSWNIKGAQINIDPLKVDFDLKKLEFKIPTTLVEVPKTASAIVSGNVFLKPLTANLNINLTKFNYQGITLNQQIANLKLKYNKRLSISTNNMLLVKINDVNYGITKPRINYIDNKISTNKFILNSGKMFRSKVSLYYNTQKSDGFIDIHKFNYTTKKLGEILKSDKKVRLEIQEKDDVLTIYSKKYNLVYVDTKYGWKVNFNSLKQLSSDSKILKNYNLTNGKFTIFKRTKDKNIKFSSEINYKHKILQKNKKTIQEYIIKGDIFSPENIFFSINDDVKVSLRKTIMIRANKIGVNLQETLNLLNSIESDNKNSSLEILIDAKNSYIMLGKDRYAIANKLELIYKDDSVYAELRHKDGKAEFKYENNQFYLYGRDFNDDFMNQLFALSKIKNGTLEFYAFGQPSNYDAMVYLDKTIIYDYVLLNNILAFVNTIPSLVTFSLPSYATKGLKVEKAYVNFSAKDDVYHVSDISMKSQEIEVLGQGVASIAQNSIDLDLNLKTNLGSSASKIPLVGYIILGKDTISTSLKITGKFDDPEVKTQMVKDILVAPLNILKRTLLLPFEIFKKDEKK